MTSSHREQALDALRRWHSEQPWARLDPSKLSITAVEPAGPVQSVLRSVFESRGVRYELRAAASRTMASVDGPDPWATELHMPPDAPVGHEDASMLRGADIPLDCAVCSAQGERSCQRCGGDGSIGSGKNRRRCDVCRGRGQVTCTTCGGSGGVIGSPIVWGRIDSHEEIRTTGTDALPLEVAFDLVERAAPGELLHRQEGELLTDVRLDGGGYRGGSTLPPEVARATEALLREPSVGIGARIRGQVLELRRTTVLEVRLEGGEAVYVWGEPPKVFPRGPLTTLLGHILPFLAR